MSYSIGMITCAPQAATASVHGVSRTTVSAMKLKSPALQTADVLGVRMYLILGQPTKLSCN